MGLSVGRPPLAVLVAAGWFSLCALGCGPAAEPEAPGADATPEGLTDVDYLLEENHYSQHGEELIFRDFFQDRRGGFFLDVGCAWPMLYSNTNYLESALGWSGIAVDALPEHAERWRRRRPRSRFFNYIVTDHSGGVETFYQTKNEELRGISTLEPRDGPAGPDVEYEEIQVPTITLTELLDREGVSRIDLLTMDIEGAEPLALAGFDIERFRPELVCIEAHFDVRQQILDYFASHGYRQIEQYLERDQVNFYFTPASTPPLSSESGY